MDSIIATTTDNMSLHFSATAQQRVRELLSFSTSLETCLRIYVSEQNCSGVKYGFAFELPEPEDRVIPFAGFKVIIDPISQTFLHGSDIDYINVDGDYNFVVSNSKSQSCCGCSNNSCC